MLGKGYGTARLANYFGCSVSTVKRRLRSFDLSIRGILYSTISDDELTEKITNIVTQGDELGN